MGSVYLTQLADWCRAEGLDVVEDSGWEHRARSSGGYESGRPWVIMWHHTASDTSPQNDVAYICHNSPDAPISNILLDRHGTVWVCAGGATNTNGKGKATSVSKGTVPADSMNTYAVSIEIANNGVGEAYPQAQIDAAFVLSNMLARRLGLAPDDCCTHQAYAPDRKIDPATAGAVQGSWQPDSVTSSGTWSLPDLQDEAERRSQPEPDEGDDVQVVEVAVFGIDARFLGYKVRQNNVDLILWVEWVNGNDDNQLWRLQAYRNLNVPVHTMPTVDDMRGVGLLGPVPTGDKSYNWTRENFGNAVGPW
jgi:hypothetical protein